MDSSAEVLEDDMGSRDDLVEGQPRKNDENMMGKPNRHVLELLARSTEGNEQLLSLVYLAVHDQLKNWGIDSDPPTTRGRSKSRKSNSNRLGRSDVGQHRPVEVTLAHWKVTVKVPILIKESCDFLREQIQTEGIFRKSGSSSRVQALMQRFSNLEKTEEFSFNSSDSVFDVATVLKQYLREMESPLIPYETHNIFRRCLEVASECSRDEAVMLTTCLLPEFNISVLTYLVEFLNEVVEHSNENRMSYENLAIVIGPNIMPVESKKSDKAKELEHERKFIDAHTKIMEILIRNGQKLGCLTHELEKKIEADISLRGSEDELENDGVQRRKKRRSGSLTRVLGFLKKVASSKSGDTPVAHTPVDFSDFTHTPVIKSGKRRCLDENIFSLQKKKTILDGIRKNGLTVKDEDKRFAHITDTPNSVTGFITCPSPVCLNPSPMMKMDWKQTPNAARFKNLVTPSLLRRKDKHGESSKSNTPFSAPSKPVKAKLLGKKSSKKQTPVLTDNNGGSRSSRSTDVKRAPSSMSIHKLANSPRKVARASSTRIPRPEKVNPIRKSSSSCRFPVGPSPRDLKIGAKISEKANNNTSSISGDYVRLSPSARIRDEQNEAFIASKLSCLEDTVDMQQENIGQGQGDPALRLTPLIQEINTLTLTAQEDLTPSGLRKKRSAARLPNVASVKKSSSPSVSSSAERAPPIPSRLTRRRSSGASIYKARLQSPPEAEASIKSGLSAQRKRSGSGRGGSNNVQRSESIKQVEDKFKRAINETKIMRIQSERSAQVNARAVSIHRRFSVQDKGVSPSQRRIMSNAARRRSHEMNRQPEAPPTPIASNMNSPIPDLSRYGFQQGGGGDSISRSPNRCTLKRGRPNTLRSGLARPSPSASMRNNSAVNCSKLNDSTKENPPAPVVVDFRHMSGSGPGSELYMHTPMRRMSSVQELVKLMEKAPPKEKSKASISDSSLKPVNRTEPPPVRRTLSRRNSSASKFIKPSIPISQKVIDVSTPRINKKRSNTYSSCTTAPNNRTNMKYNTDDWVAASDFNFESHRTRFLNRLSGQNEDRNRDSIQALKALNAGKVSENVRLFDGMCRTRKSPGKSLIPRYTALHKQESFIVRK